MALASGCTRHAACWFPRARRDEFASRAGHLPHRGSTPHRPGARLASTARVQRPFNAAQVSTELANRDYMDAPLVFMSVAIIVSALIAAFVATQLADRF